MTTVITQLAIAGKATMIETEGNFEATANWMKLLANKVGVEYEVRFSQWGHSFTFGVDLNEDEYYEIEFWGNCKCEIRKYDRNTWETCEVVEF